MTQPAPGIKRQDTFATVVRTLSLLTKYGNAMLKKVRGKRASGIKSPILETPPVPLLTLPAQEDTIQDMDWKAILELIRKAGKKHVLVNFYSPHV